jgi:hypothetical protein
MNPTNRPSTASFEPSHAALADRSDRHDSESNVLIELDESALAQVAGGAADMFLPLPPIRDEK